MQRAADHTYMDADRLKVPTSSLNDVQNWRADEQLLRACGIAATWPDGQRAATT
jgi:hypothetical protein